MHISSIVRIFAKEEGRQMIKDERKNQLLKLIGRTGYIKVNELAAKIYTSPSTVRRNLSELEKMGLIRRVSGGAELRSDSLEVPMQLRYKKNHEQKTLIAERAAEHLKDDTVVFIDGSSTCLHMVPFISQHKNITVYTNGVEICSQLCQTDINVYCVGGELLPRSLAFAGEYAISMVQSVYFDALFFSCSSFSDGMVTDYSEKEAHLRRALIRQSKEKYFLCDHSKIGKRHSYIICNENDITEIITE